VVHELLSNVEERSRLRAGQLGAGELEYVGWEIAAFGTGSRSSVDVDSITAFARGVDGWGIFRTGIGVIGGFIGRSRSAIPGRQINCPIPLSDPCNALGVVVAEA
jgi:hypothetical protein